MKINENHAFSTAKVLLVPYSAHHVPTYHAWMQDPDLQAATASEPLKLDEEYDMQRSWREDRDKLTFIVCLPLASETEDTKAGLRPGVEDAPDRMIGDINLFLFEPDDDDDDGAGANTTTELPERPRNKSVVGEMELMIARKDLHRKGYGRASLLTFLRYIIMQWPSIYLEYTSSTSSRPEAPGPNEHAELRYLRVKIQQSNVSSIALFESVGFQRTAEGVNYFGEVELRLQDAGDGSWRQLDREGGEWEATVLPYDDQGTKASGER